MNSPLFSRSSSWKLPSIAQPTPRGTRENSSAGRPPSSSRTSGPSESGSSWPSAPANWPCLTWAWTASYEPAISSRCASEMSAMATGLRRAPSSCSKIPQSRFSLKSSNPPGRMSPTVSRSHVAPGRLPVYQPVACLPAPVHAAIRAYCGLLGAANWSGSV
jgi:hypothetical protein